MARIIFCFFALAAELFPLGAGGADIYVSAKSSGGDGSEQRPFPNIESALAAVSKAGGPEKMGEAVNVVLLEGDYIVKRGIVVERALSGTPKYPLRIVGQGRVNLIGAAVADASGLREVPDASIPTSLPKRISGKLYFMDLRGKLFSKIAPPAQVGFGFPKSASETEAFYSESEIMPARYPNEGYIPLGDVVQKTTGKSGGAFAWHGDRAKNWANAEGFMLSGMLNYGWAWHRLFARVDASKKAIEIKTPFPTGLRPDGFRLAVNHYKVSHLIEELDAPNEYFIDAKNERFYVILDKAPPKGARLYFSLLEDPIITLNGVDNVEVHNINFRATRGTAIWLNKCSNAEISACSFRDIGACAVSTGAPYPASFAKKCPIKARPGESAGNVLSQNNTIRNCFFKNVGDDAIMLSGGDNKTLRKSGHLVSNCRFEGNARVNLQSVQVMQSTCGGRVEHCAFSNTPYIVILYSGSENIIEKNVFDRCNSEFHDSSVVYSGRRPNDCGNVVRLNFFAECSAADKRTMLCGVYVDDGSSNHRIEKNIFCRVGTPGVRDDFSAVYFHAGGGNIVEKNIFVDCPVASSQVWWNDAHWTDYWKTAKQNQPKDIDLGVYLKKYPYVSSVYDASPRINSLLFNKTFRTSMPVKGWFFLNGNTSLDGQFKNVPKVERWSLGLFERYFSTDPLAKEILSAKPGLAGAAGE